ncbi:hypothetical protein EI427_10430 [Flammeovirga pectinis]|uniref:Uncharacterized protein n=1 Tax=Flammeovirga pectinis TaxID=2494373 RepID=A0A3Q9FPZ2_9BACT|nr:hypothetical protein [Flammeovirga pectinis]AZQ62638.1 hypothetical protein EI427_10430 [Flammeovirga pectinis]
MKKLFIITVILLTSLLSFAQKGKTFPTIKAETLTDKSITFPGAVKGKVTLIGVAYSKKSQENLESWMQPIYDTFINPPKSDIFGSAGYDVNMYFLALARGIAKSAEKSIKSNMKKKIDSKLHKNVAIVLGDVKHHKANLGLGAKDDPYFYILSPEGKVLFITYGKYTPSKMSALEEAIDEYSE